MRDGQEASESLSEQAVPVLTPRDINELDPEDIIGFFFNRKPFRARRMDWRKFPELIKRRSLPPPLVHPLPEVSEILLPSHRTREGSWPAAAIDPDAIN
jgi:hypothetical protein